MGRFVPFMTAAWALSLNVEEDFPLETGPLRGSSDALLQDPPDFPAILAIKSYCKQNICTKTLPNRETNRLIVTDLQ